MRISCNEVNQSSPKNVSSSKGIWDVSEKFHIQGDEPDTSLDFGVQDLPIVKSYKKVSEGDQPITELVVRICPLASCLHGSSSIKETPIEAWVWLSLK